jgi:hypothetical protein
VGVGLEFLAASEASFTLAPALLIALGRTNSFKTFSVTFNV